MPHAEHRWCLIHGSSTPSGSTEACAGLLQHVITAQPYIPELIRTLESQGVLPLPIFINGVEAHTLVSLTLNTLHPIF